jgi:hypothetical protein
VAIRNDRRIGRVRFKLACMLAERFPELRSSYRQRERNGDPVKLCVDPFLLTPQYPVYASPKFDCCSWDADLPLKERGSYHVYSWSKMSDLVRHGFNFTKDGYEIELSEATKR